ncbi:hypothetical protein ABT126_34680 [Streptomyces sp. NPDC002012]|uniref:hypothetical protein n=1 Tax=Streptomyces sp. NPDC002012 TaxID=3154532 RepID=UPI003333F42D
MGGDESGDRRDLLLRQWVVAAGMGSAAAFAADVGLRDEDADRAVGQRRAPAAAVR